MSAIATTVRAATPADIDEIAGLLAAYDTALGRSAPIEVDQLRGFLAAVDLPHESWLLHDGARLAAAAWLITRDPEVAAQFGWVDPARVGRGLGSRLLELSELRGRAIGARVVHADLNVADTAAAVLLAGSGYRPVRSSYEMAIDLDAPPPPPRWPDGIRVAAFRTEDARAFYAASNEAFADEWDFTPMSYEEFLRLRVEGGDTSAWFLAWDGDDVAGFARCDREYRGAGLVRMLGVRTPWRRRGLGEALLLHAFGEFRRRGQRRVMLGVDAENPTGATRLYERVGMRVSSRGATYEKELA